MQLEGSSSLVADDDNSLIAQSSFNTLWGDPTHSKAIDDDNKQYPAADRMAVLLGTSNRITPINENFGLGQAVMI